MADNSQEGSPILLSASSIAVNQADTAPPPPQSCLCVHNGAYAPEEARIYFLLASSKLPHLTTRSHESRAALRSICLMSFAADTHTSAARDSLDRVCEHPQLASSDSPVGPARTPARKPSKPASKAGLVSTHLPSILSLAVWTASSSGLIVLNKRLLVDDGFNFPLALTGAGQTASFLMGLILATGGWVTLGKPPTLRFYLTRLLPLVICSAGTLFLGNVAYLHLSVAFIQILKAATPAFTLTICALAGLERPTAPLLASVGMIVVGTAVATLVEAGGAGFSWLGLAYFTASALLEAVRVVYIQLLLGSLKYSAAEVLVFLGPPTAAVLFAASYVWEYDGLVARGAARVAARPAAYLCAVLMGFLVNMSTAKAIEATSGLTFKVFGCVKNSVVVACGMLLGDRVAPVQLAGYALSTLGFVVFSRAKLSQGRGQRRTRKKSV